jgi:hypothetical protein
MDLDATPAPAASPGEVRLTLEKDLGRVPHALGTLAALRKLVRTPFHARSHAGQALRRPAGDGGY